MNRNWQRRAAGGLPILSAALLSTVGLLAQGAVSSAAAQTYSGGSGEVIVNYDALDALGAQSAPYGAQPSPPVAPAPYAPYRPVTPYYTPPTGAPMSALTTLGPDGRPLTPIKLRKPGSGTSPAQTAAITPPGEPSEVPAEVPMPEPTPQAPAPGENTGQIPEVPVVETPEPPAEASTSAGTPAPYQSAQYGEEPTPEQPAEQAAEQPTEQPAEQQASQEPPAEAPAPEAPAAETPPAEGEAATEEEQPTEEAAAEAPPEPDNTQPAPPIPQGGIRIVFPMDLNDVPPEANAALDDLAAQMLADETMRIEIKCYASGTEDSESKARRKSLARCLSIRQHLFKMDVRTTRMDVRALGLKSEGQPADRVDIVPANS